MDAITEAVERSGKMRKLIIRLKSGYEIPVTCEDFSFTRDRLSGMLLNYEIKGVKYNAPLYFRLEDVECIVEIRAGDTDIPKSTLRTDCTGCRFIGSYDTEFPCANCVRKNKDYYDAERR